MTTNDRKARDAQRRAQKRREQKYPPINHPYTYNILEIPLIFAANMMRIKIDLGFDNTTIIDATLQNITIHYNSRFPDGKTPLRHTIEWIDNHTNLQLYSHGRAYGGRWLVTIHSEQETLNEYLENLGLHKQRILHQDQPNENH
jgi:hypothetical protein